MLLELAVVPLARGPSLSANVAELTTIIDSSGLDYRLTPQELSSKAIGIMCYMSPKDAARKCEPGRSG